MEEPTQPRPLNSAEPHEEEQYLDLIRDVIERGSWEATRNGKTKSLFGRSMRFSLKDGQIPLITTKKLAWKTCFRELSWFMGGRTDNRLLNNMGVHIWDANASRDFLDSTELYQNRVGDLGPVYPHQWRHYGAEYRGCDVNYDGEGIDQLQNIIDGLQDPDTRSSRRHVLTAWNPTQLHKMALPPCHVIAQFNVRDGKYLSCAMYQRSGDVGLGVPFNIASYAFLTHLLAKHCGLEAEDFVYFLGNAHIYEGHLDALKTQIGRKPCPFPRIKIANCYRYIEDYDVDDVEFLEGFAYACHGGIQMDMVA
jgi:thymidylate synthase